METIAVGKNIRISAQKVRLVADVVRGMKVDDALAQLRFSPKSAAEPLAKVIKSAAHNAIHNDQSDRASLIVSMIRIGEAASFKRMKPRARGQSDRIVKRGSHIKVGVSERS